MEKDTVDKILFKLAYVKSPTACGIDRGSTNSQPLRFQNVMLPQFLFWQYVKSAVYTSTEHEDSTETLKHWGTRTTATITLDTIKHV